MTYAANILVVLVATLHLYFLILEMFFWTKPLGLKVFRQTLEKAKDSSVLAANQGLYNGFLSAGLIWGLLHPDATVSLQIKVFFLVCVVLAGIFGAFTVNKRIFFIQSLPAILALFAQLLILHFHNVPAMEAKTFESKKHAITRPFPHTPAAVIPVTGSVAKPPSEPEATIDYDSMCWNQVSDAYKASCPDGKCLYRESEGSWIRSWFEDGWLDKLSGQPLTLTKPQSTAYGKLTYALAQTDLVLGIAAQSNTQEALHTLKLLHAQDPSNSAPLLFAAVINERLGRHTQALSLLEYAHRTTSRFDIYMKDLVREIYRVAEKSDLLTVEAILTVSSLPVPNYNALSDFLLSVGGPAEDFAAQMAQDGTIEPRVEGITWIPIEYAVARKIFIGKQKPFDYPDLQTLLRNEIEAFQEHFNNYTFPQCENWREGLQGWMRRIKSVNH